MLIPISKLPNDLVSLKVRVREGFNTDFDALMMLKVFTSAKKLNIP